MIEPLADLPAPTANHELERQHAALEACPATWEPDIRLLLVAYDEG